EGAQTRLFSGACAVGNVEYFRGAFAVLGKHPDQAARSGVGLDTPAHTARARPGVRRRVDGEVADFAREPVRTWVQLVSDHQTPADAGPQRHHQKARVAPTVAIQPFAERCGGGVVFHSDGAAQPLAQTLTEHDALEARHVGQAPAFAFTVDFARDGDPDA